MNTGVGGRSQLPPGLQKQMLAGLQDTLKDLIDLLFKFLGQRAGSDSAQDQPKELGFVR